MHATARPFDHSDAARLQPAFGKLISLARHRVNEAVWRPAWKSPAAEEIAATRDLARTDGTPWGEAPASTVVPLIRMDLESVLQHVSAVHLMLSQGAGLGLAIDSETRAALEAAAQLWWLLDKDLTPRGRVARLYAHRRDTAVKLEDVLGKMGISAASGYGAMPADLDKHYEQELGLSVNWTTNANGVTRWVDCEGQAPMKYSSRVRLFVEKGMGQSPSAGYYAYYCGASHSEGWRILYQYAQATAADGSDILKLRTAAATVNMAVNVCIDALFYAAARAYEYLGDGAGVRLLAMQVEPIKAAARMPA